MEIRDKAIRFCKGRDAIKNIDFVVDLITRHGSTTRFARDAKGWVQTASSGVSRRCIAEQVLNHLLLAIVLGDSLTTTEVKLKRGRHFHPRLERLRGAPEGLEISFGPN